MARETEPPPPEDGTPLGRKVAAGVKRRQRARGSADGIWSGLSLIGTLGWSVALPMLIGALVGIGLDHHYPGQNRWTLTLLLLGLAVGCFQGWRWMVKQSRDLDQKEGPDDHA